MYSRLSTKSNRFYWFISPTPVFLPGEFCGQRSLPGYSPLGHKDWVIITHSHYTVQAGFKMQLNWKKKKRKWQSIATSLSWYQNSLLVKNRDLGNRVAGCSRGSPSGTEHPAPPSWLRRWEAWFPPCMARTSRAGLWWAWPQWTVCSDAPGCRRQAPAWNQSILLKTMPQRYMNTETLYLSLEINFSRENYTAVLCVC